MEASCGAHHLAGQATSQNGNTDQLAPPRTPSFCFPLCNHTIVTTEIRQLANRVAAFARDWRADRQRDQQTTGRGTFVPLSFRPGEAFQFDWSEDFAVLGGERCAWRWGKGHMGQFSMEIRPLAHSIRSVRVAQGPQSGFA